MKDNTTTITTMSEIDSMNITEQGKKLYRIDVLSQLNIGIDITIETLSRIDLYLIPVKLDGKIGFIDTDANLVIKPLFDKYKGTFDSKDSLVKVLINNKWGVINTEGVFIVEAKYSSIFISDDKKLFTVNLNYKWGVINDNGDNVVEFGEYSYIDGFDSNLARVKIKDKWGIIDLEGRIVLSVEYDNIWNFYKKNRKSTLVEKEGHRQPVNFNNLYQAKNHLVEKSEYPSFDNDDYHYHQSAYEYPEYNDSLDMDQQSMEFWNNF